MNNKNENITIDFNYAKKQRESILINEKSIIVNTELEIFSIPMKDIIELHILLSNVAKRIIYNDLQDECIRIIILSYLTNILDKLGDIAIFLNIDLISIGSLKVYDLEDIINSLFNSISILDNKKEIARIEICNRMVSLLADLIHNLDFSLHDVKEYYLNIKKKNIKNI